jgi:hypothetical protein
VDFYGAFTRVGRIFAVIKLLTIKFKKVSKKTIGALL